MILNAAVVVEGQWVLTYCSPMRVLVVNGKQHHVQHFSIL